MNTVSELRELLNSAGSHIFHIWFMKKDLTVRHMVCQIPAIETHKSLNPDPSHQQGAETRREQHPELFLVYDLEAKGIRSFDVRNLIRATINRKMYEFDSMSVNTHNVLQEDLNANTHD